MSNNWIWLIKTQLDEIREHQEHGDKLKECNEYADIIGICLQAIEDLGYFPKEIIEARIQKNIDRISEIAYKYREKWKEYEQERI